jgi:hypothetical protein
MKEPASIIRAEMDNSRPDPGDGGWVDERCIVICSGRERGCVPLSRPERTVRINTCHAGLGWLETGRA